jgi:hypothetical protein
VIVIKTALNFLSRVSSRVAIAGRIIYKWLAAGMKARKNNTKQLRIEKND